MLRYVGNGFVVGIPARDLGEEEMAELEVGVWRRMSAGNARMRRMGLRRWLVEGGMYVEGGGRGKMRVGGSEDK